MKIDEDLIHEQIENVRNELVKYINSYMTQEERNDHGDNLMNICHRAQLPQMKLEQMVRDNKQLKENEFLNQERMKHFEF